MTSTDVDIYIVDELVDEIVFITYKKSKTIQYLQIIFILT